MEKEKVLLRATLVYLIKENKIFLALKTKKIGEGKLNGYGGGFEGDESLEECAQREFYEESDGVKIEKDSLEQIAVVDFYNEKEDGGHFTCRVYVFLAYRWEGEAKDTDEMINGAWYNIDNLPLDRMMPADKVWLTEALKHKDISAFAHYKNRQKELIGDVIIKHVNSFDEY